MSITNSNCWVQFWENDDYGSGGNYRFNYSVPDEQKGLPMCVNDLSECYWSGYSEKAGNQMDDSINSLKTGPSTWLYVFSRSGYSGDVLKVGPGQSIGDLDEKHPDSGGNWQNTIVSFIIYDHQPACWDTGSPTLPGSCWVKMYTGSRYTSSSYTLYGPDAVVNNACIDNYRYYGTTYVNGYPTNTYLYRAPRSLVTGPATWVQLYGGINLGTLIGQFGPNSLVRDLTAYSSSTVMSMRIWDSMPEGFSPSAQTPSMVLTIQKYQTAAQLESVLGAAIGYIPLAGGMLSGLLDALWPSGPGTAEIWNDMTTYMQAMMTGLINQSHLDDLTKALSSYYDIIADYKGMTSSPDKAGKLGDILTMLQRDKPNFLDPSNPQQNLTYLLAFGSIDVLMLAERAYNYAILSTAPGKVYGGDANAQQALDNLAKEITELTQAAATAVTNALDWRVKLITLKNTGGISTDYLVSDTYSGYSAKYSKQADAQAAQQQLQAYVKSQYSELLQAYITPSGLWGYLTPANTIASPGSNNSNFPTISFRQPNPTPPTPQTVTMAVGSFPNTSGGTAFSENVGPNTVTGVTLYSSGTNNGGYVTGFQFKYSNQASGIQGKTGASTVSVTFDKDEYIVALYGGSSSRLDQLYFRTNKGRDFGLGSNTGTDFAGAAPQGTTPVLTSLQGTKADYINSLALSWQYQAAKPYQA